MCKFMVVLSDNAVTIYASFWAQLSRQVFRKPRAAMPEPSSSAASASPPQRLQPKAPTPLFPRALGVLQDQPKQKQQSVPREAGSTLELREDMGYANTGQLTYLLAVDIEINGPWFLHSLSLSLSLPLAFSMSSAELKAWFL